MRKSDLLRCSLCLFFSLWIILFLFVLLKLTWSLHQKPIEGGYNLYSLDRDIITLLVCIQYLVQRCKMVFLEKIVVNRCVNWPNMYGRDLGFAYFMRWLYYGVSVTFYALTVHGVSIWDAFNNTWRACELQIAMYELQLRCSTNPAKGKVKLSKSQHSHIVHSHLDNQHKHIRPFPSCLSLFKSPAQNLKPIGEKLLKKSWTYCNCVNLVLNIFYSASLVLNLLKICQCSPSEQFSLEITNVNAGYPTWHRWRWR